MKNKENKIPNCYEIIDERATYHPDITSNKALKRQTEWIAKSAMTPLFHTEYGTIINTECYIFDSRSIKDKM